MADSRQLRGWKEIADHLGLSERSAKRWEQSHGLPVHRVPGSGRDTVLADTAELDQWKNLSASDRAAEMMDGDSPDTLGTDFPSTGVSGPPASRRRSSRRALTLGLIVLAVVAAVFYVWRSETAPTAAPPTIMLRLSTTDGWTAMVGVQDGREGTVTIGGKATMTLRPHLDGDFLLLEVGSPDGLPAATAPSGIRLRTSETVRVTGLIPFDVEWVATRPPKPKH